MSTVIIRLPDDTAIDTDNPFPVTLQSKLMTDATGLNSRLRVDVGQTGFFAGREFKTFKEFSITSGSSYVLKFV